MPLDLVPPDLDGAMDQRIAAVAMRQGMVFRRAQALSCGFSEEEIRQRLRNGEWRRVRRGTYADALLFDALDEIGRHRLLAYAVALSLQGRIVFSHATAAAMHGLPLWGVPLDVVHVYRQDRQSPRWEAGVQHHVARCPEEDVMEVGGLLVTRPARTAVDLARLVEFEAGVVVADAVLNRSLTDPAELRRHLEIQRDWPGARTAGAVVAFADGRAESPGESRSRILFARFGLPAPELQVEFRDVDGVLFARVDFLFVDERTVGEYDGRVKYRLGGGKSTGDAERILMAEKRREDLIREAGYEVVRLINEDLYHGRRTANRFRAAFARAARRYRTA